MAIEGEAGTTQLLLNEYAMHSMKRARESLERRGLNKVLK